MSRILLRQLNIVEKRTLSTLLTTTTAKRTFTQLPRMAANRRLTQTKNFLLSPAKKVMDTAAVVVAADNANGILNSFLLFHLRCLPLPPLFLA